MFRIKSTPITKKEIRNICFYMIVKANRRMLSVSLNLRSILPLIEQEHEKLCTLILAVIIPKPNALNYVYIFLDIFDAV